MTTTKHTKTATRTTGAQVFLPLDKLKKSPVNVRKTPHGEVTLSALTASIVAKGILQNLTVAPERDLGGSETGPVRRVDDVIGAQGRFVGLGHGNLLRPMNGHGIMGPGG